MGRCLCPPLCSATQDCPVFAANNRQMTMAALFSFAYLNKDMQMVLISPQVGKASRRLLCPAIPRLLLTLPYGAHLIYRQRSTVFMVRASTTQSLSKHVCVVQDLRGVEEAKQMLAEDPRDPMALPDGFVRIVRVLPARANAMQGS